jgi:hypothetical protein
MTASLSQIHQLTGINTGWNGCSNADAPLHSPVQDRAIEFWTSATRQEYLTTVRQALNAAEKGCVVCFGAEAQFRHIVAANGKVLTILRNIHDSMLDSSTYGWFGIN